MNKNHTIKNKLLKNIALGSFLLGNFTGAFSKIQASMNSAAANDISRLERLIAERHDPNARNSNGATPLHFAGTKKAVELLLKAGGGANAQNKSGNTPLHFFLRKIQYPEVQSSGSDKTKEVLIGEKRQQASECAKVLLQNGANGGIANNAGLTPVFIVCCAAQTGEYPGNGQRTPVAHEARALYNELVPLFGPQAGQPRPQASRPQAGQLHRAVANGNREETLRLLEAGADPNERHMGYTAFLCVCDLCVCDPWFVRTLHQYKADINAPNEFGDTPLHLAIWDDHMQIELVEALLQCGAKIDIKNRRNDTPVDMVRQALKENIIVNGGDQVIPVDGNMRQALTRIERLFQNYP
jgi:ankyrin repeat protein